MCMALVGRWHLSSGDRPRFDAAQYNRLDLGKHLLDQIDVR